MRTRVKTAKEIADMRIGGKMLAQVLQYVKAKTEVGMSTKMLADLAAEELKRLGGKPAILGYQGFPDVICISLNAEVVHGIPRSTTILREGDILSLDFCVLYNGLITDSATTYIVGRPKSLAHEKLLRGTEESLHAGIEVVRNGVRTGDLGFTIGGVLAEKHYGIVRDLVGHGVGEHMHEEPNLPNYGRKGTGMQLEAGMTIAIEPMATLGTDDIYVANDGWTIVTQDGSMSAHFEHTVLVTQDGAEILTKL